MYVYTVECYSAIKKNEILSFAITWMDLEGIVLNEINQIKKDKYCVLSLNMWNLKSKMYVTKQKQTQRYRELMVTNEERKSGRE